MESLKITSGRNFSFHNRKFRVADLPKADRTDGKKYMIQEITKDGSCSIMYNSINWEMLKFPTIKEARRWISDWEWCTKALF